MSCTAPSQKLLMATAERQRMFALRFRTALCEKYETCGACEYRRKCMFAHGANELRTVEMNEEDGLFSDKAVRDFVRTLAQHRRRHRSSNDGLGNPSKSHPTITTTVSTNPPDEHTEAGSSTSSTVESSSSVETFKYRHNPYSF
jgi:hypothetical protein